MEHSYPLRKRFQNRLGGPYRLLSMACLLAVLAASTGCRTIDNYDRTLEQPVAPQIEPPRELAKRALPAYRIEPPDVLQIEVLKLVPLPPYRVEAFDVLKMSVLGTLMDQPINDYFLVDAEGSVNLGAGYGQVRVVGMTIEEATEAIRGHLTQILSEPEVSVQLAQASGTQAVTGTYLVGPDGAVNLRQYGMVNVAGKTLAEAKQTIERHLAHFFDSPEASVDVAAFNSKVYYIVLEGAGMGDSVVRVPVTGNETVLDAISQVQGLTRMSSKKIWIARPTPGGSGCDQVLPVDWDAITQGAVTSTNYQLMPGDRVFVAEDSVLAMTNFVSRITQPFQSVLGFSSLGVSTIRNFNSINIPISQ